MSRLIPTAAERFKARVIAFRLAHPDNCVDAPGRVSFFDEPRRRNAPALTSGPLIIVQRDVTDEGAIVDDEDVF